MSTSINDLEIYRESMRLAEVIWDSVGSWPWFAKDTLGKQIVRSADSIAANIAEGYGRYHFKENQKFCYYSRGSVQETQTWIEKAVRRDLIPDEEGPSPLSRARFSEEAAQRLHPFNWSRRFRHQ